MNAVLEQSAIDPKAFRRALGNFATGVTIITAQAPDGTQVGVTASSFNSLSMDPPLILWSSMKEARSCAIFEAAEHFAVNVLAADQMEMSNHFARQQPDKFADVEWESGIGGAPIFPDCAARFQCESYAKLDGGDHWIFVGRVLDFHDFGRAPLCFHQGSYSMVFNHPGTSTKTELVPASGRMGSHSFFMMLRAVRAYQDRYQPKLEALDLSLIEARILLVLNDMDGLSAEELVLYLHTTITEARASLASLTGFGFIADDAGTYRLTEAGLQKAESCWSLAEAHAEDTFKDFDPEDLEIFGKVLSKLIER